MAKKPLNILEISRLLTPEHRDDLLTWVNLAYVAENSARKAFNSDATFDGVFPLKTQEYSCRNNLPRSKK